MQIEGENCYGKGTLGFIARGNEPPPERIVAITAHHALFSSPQAEVAEMRVGQSKAEESCSKCCDQMFGKFLLGFRDATMDAAAILLDPKTEYYQQIEDIGITNGDYEITEAEAKTGTYLVRKRGCTTRVTGGTVVAIHSTHKLGSPSNYMVIKPNPCDDASSEATFADWGDSGAAVVSEKNEVVGLLFGVASVADANVDDNVKVGWGFAWGITEVKSRFAATGLDLIVPVGTLNEKRIVAVHPGDDKAASLEPVPEKTWIRGEIARDLETSDLGSLLVELWRRHFAEVNRLVNTNRKVATRWHRLGGSALLQAALRSVYSVEARVPETISGRSADECLHIILDVFEEYGSPALKQDIRSYRALIPRIGGASYAELLDVLRESQGGQPWRT